MTTAFPIAEAIPRLQPGVYVLAAYASAKKDDDGSRNAATQWFIVSDLGLTAINGDDGMHAFVRSLATARPVADASVRLIARNNEVLGYGQDRQPRLRPLRGRPEARRRRPGAGGAGRRDRRRRLRLPRLVHGAPSISPTAASRAATAPGPIDAFAYTDRGVYRAGEQVHLTALARDRTGKASGVPVTVIFSRPDGVEHARVDAHRPGPGRAHDHAGARRLRHDRHLARQDPHRPQVAARSRRRHSWSRTSSPSAWTSSSSRPCRRSPRRSRAPSSSPAAISTARRPPALPSRARSP